MLKKAGLLTRPTPAITSPARPESAKTASSPRDAPYPMQGRNSAVDPRFTFHASRFTAAGSTARTPLADFLSILLVFQFISHSTQQMRHAKGLLKGLPCPEEFRDIQDILFLSCA